MLMILYLIVHFVSFCFVSFRFVSFRVSIIVILCENELAHRLLIQCITDVPRRGGSANQPTWKSFNSNKSTMEKSRKRNNYPISWRKTNGIKNTSRASWKKPRVHPKISPRSKIYWIDIRRSRTQTMILSPKCRLIRKNTKRDGRVMPIS